MRAETLADIVILTLLGSLVLNTVVVIVSLRRWMRRD